MTAPFPSAPCARCSTPRPSPDARFCQQCGTALPVEGAPGDPLLGTVLLGRYRVLSVLGEGSMGRVYLGEQRVGEGARRVAIKVLASTRGQEPYAVARFRREAATLASLDHPNIIRIHDYGEEDGRLLFVMEHVAGGSLGDLLRAGPLSLARAQGIAWQVAAALEEAHRHGVVHRDLKPENVLLARTADGRDGVKVVDFGIARRPAAHANEKALTALGTLLGTPAYMSPEQYRGEPVDLRADVYALALLVYQMIAGRPPWAVDTLAEWADAHLRRPPMPLTFQPGCTQLPGRCDGALAHALAKQPADRTASALELMREFTGRAAPEDLPRNAPMPVAGSQPTPAGADGAYHPTLQGGPEPTGVRRRVPWAGLLVCALGAGVCAYACMLALRAPGFPPGVTHGHGLDGAASAPAVGTTDGGPDGGVVAQGVHGTGRVGEHTPSLVQAGLTAARQGQLEPALAALERARRDPALSPAAVAPLRAAVEDLGAQTAARMARTDCAAAQDLVRRLARVAAAESARRHLGRHCHVP